MCNTWWPLSPQGFAHGVGADIVWALMWLPPYLLLLLCTAGLTLGEEDGAEGQGKGEATREGEGGEDFLKEPMVIAFASGVLVIICLIGLYGLSRFQERTGWSWPTPSCVTMCIGIAVGGLARWWGISEDGDAFTFNDDVFSAIVLPIVFMNFGYNSRVRFLRLNIGSTLFFALGSTLLCLFLFTTILFLVIKQVSYPSPVPCQPPSPVHSGTAGA